MKNNYKKFGVGFALKAGKIMRKNFSLGMKKDLKADNSIVTVTDKKINSLLIKDLKKYFPTHSLLGEEESNIIENSEYVWVCDPVDGTVPFAHGIPTSTFSLALTKNGQPIFAVICNPFVKYLFTAEKGKGAFLNGEKISVSKHKEFENTVCAFEKWGKSKYDVTNIFDYLSKDKGTTTLRLCSIIFASAMVAAGELAFSIFPHITAHDAATIKLIVEEAGGKVTDLFGKEQRYDKPIKGFIASNGLLHKDLVKLSKKFTKLNNR